MANTPRELDYSFFKGQGIAYIQQLAGKKWTDFEDHDPGITILEVLSFAIMDLEYRTNFYIEDIWAKEPDAVAKPNEKQFYSAEEILPCNPLTQWDFLKVVLDVPGVKNANIFLSDGPKEIKGGYKVFVDIEERIRHTAQEKEVLDLVKQRLHAQRNLCEDFFLIQTMQTLLISIKATFEVSHCLAYEEGELMIAQLLFRFQEFLSPSIPFYNLTQLLDRGRTIDQIFTGPRLTQGFIDEEELIAIKSKSRIHTAELLEKATKVTGIKGVFGFELFIDEESAQTNSLTVPVLPDRSLALNIPKSEIILSYNGVPIRIDWEKVLDFLEHTKGRGTLTKAYLQEEVSVLEGNYRNLKDYISIQQDFPLLYNVGHEGCTPSETTENKAKAKQLKSYLMFFDQLFANYLGQLSNIKHTMAVYSDDYNKPNGQLPLDVPNINTIIKQPTKEHDPGNDLEFIIQKKYLDLKKNMAHTITPNKEVADETTRAYLAYVNNGLESAIQSLHKRSKMLDHLLAYFAERFTTYSLHLYTKNEEERLNSRNLYKALFLKDYIDISKNRNRAVDITRKDLDPWTHYVPSGFKRRLYRSLGIKCLEKRLLHKVVKDNLHVEQKSSQSDFDIFLGKNNQVADSDLFMFKGKYENIQSLAIAYGMNEEHYNIIKTTDGTYNILLYIDKIKKNTIELVTESLIEKIEQAEHVVQQSMALFKSLNEKSEGFHLIEHILLRNSDVLETVKDPYSFTMTMVFPSWPAKFQQSSFRRSVEEMVVMESPAHLFINILWLDFKDMETFEQAYKLWVQLKADPTTAKIEVDAAAKTLMDIIELHNNQSSLCLSYTSAI